jgi:hypothetical protein
MNYMSAFNEQLETDELYHVLYKKLKLWIDAKWGHDGMRFQFKDLVHFH